MPACFHDQGRGGEILEVTFSYQWQRGAWDKLPAVPFSIRTCCSLLVIPSRKKNGNKQNPQRVKQKKELIVEWTLFPPLGELRTYVRSKGYGFASPKQPQPAHTGQDLAPSLAGSFHSSSFWSLSGFHPGHVDRPGTTPLNCSPKGMYPFCSNDQYNHSWIRGIPCLGTQLFSCGSSGCKNILFSS